MPKHLESVLYSLNLQSHHWLAQVQRMETGYSRAIGSMEKIRQWAQRFNLKSLKGISAAKLLYEKPV